MAATLDSDPEQAWIGRAFETHRRRAGPRPAPALTHVISTVVLMARGWDATRATRFER